MQERENKTLTRANYAVPKGEEHVVHYTAEKVLFEGKSGIRVSHPDLIKTDVKMFDSVKRNLELQGYTINILFHPQGKYPEEIVSESALEKAARELAEKEEEIAKLKAMLEEQNATKKEVAEKGIAPEKDEANSEIATEKEGVDLSGKKAKGRPKKD